jgi:hypothetical protein
MDTTTVDPRAAAASPAGATSGHAPFSGTLDDLLRLDADALAALYRSARVPRLADVAGALRGRMLAVVGLPPVLRAPVRACAASDLFPWRGKSFTPRDGERGEGINRVLSDRFTLFRFTTFVGPSRAGAFAAVQLDYDHASNPFFIRAIKDEIRELRPGLWLGQAYAAVGKKEHLVLYFGLSSWK